MGKIFSFFQFLKFLIWSIFGGNQLYSTDKQSCRGSTLEDSCRASRRHMTVWETGTVGNLKEIFRLKNYNIQENILAEEHQPEKSFCDEALETFML